MPPTPANRRHVQRALLAWHRRDGMRAPWRDSGDPYQALVAAVMAQQTQMSRVLPSYERFVAAFPTIDSLATASLGEVIRVWKGMGYNQRAVRLHRASRTIAEHGWPRDVAALCKIDGIGPSPPRSSPLSRSASPPPAWTRTSFASSPASPATIRCAVRACKGSPTCSSPLPTRPAGIRLSWTTAPASAALVPGAESAW